MNGHNSLANTSKHRATVLNALDDTRIRNVRHLISPQLLVEEEYPITVKAASTVLRARAEVEDILARTDDRLIVVVGPCSIHNVDAAIAYAKLLKACADRLQDDLLIIMRSYFSKPRSTTGWKGLISDPDLDGSFQINKGLRMARKLYLDLNNMGVPVACEFLDTISPQWLADLVSWGAIGARTTESQVHRELVSGLSCAVGLKNGTNGDCKIAIDGCIAARAPHVFLSVGKVGLAAIVETEGNPWAHVILRGGSSGPNYDAESVAKVCDQLKKAGLPEYVVVDCSHGNSNKDHRNQPNVSRDIGEQIKAGSMSVVGVMIESNLVEGRQDVPATGPQDLVFGKSITDACVDWNTTEQMLEELAAAVRVRRELLRSNKETLESSPGP